MKRFHFAVFSAVILPFLGFSSAFAQVSLDCSVGTKVDPKCFSARVVPTFKVVLTSYGSIQSQEDQIRIGELLKKRFHESTDGALSLEIVDYAVIPLKAEPRDLTEIRNEVKDEAIKRDEARLTRLWYYYNVEPEALVDEIQAQLIAGGMKNALSQADGVLVFSGPQFEGMGFATGAYGVTEQPSESAWSAINGANSEVVTDERLVDELLHELGHVLGLDHASAKCFDGSITGAARVACCKASPGRSDVMSYCRDRSAVQGPYYFRYTSCTKSYLLETVLPNLLKGGERLFQKAPCD